jgi:hypothetical protein
VPPTRRSELKTGLPTGFRHPNAPLVVDHGCRWGDRQVELTRQPPVGRSNANPRAQRPRTSTYHSTVATSAGLASLKTRRPSGDPRQRIGKRRLPHKRSLAVRFEVDRSGDQRSSSRSIPTSTARSVGSSSQSIRRSARRAAPAPVCRTAERTRESASHKTDLGWVRAC